MIKKGVEKIKFIFLILIFVVQKTSAEVFSYQTQTLPGSPAIDLILDDNYLVLYTLGRSTAQGHLSDDVVKFQDFAWDLNQPLYREIRNLKYGSVEALLQATREEEIQNFINILINSDEYKAVRNQTRSYIESSIDEWNKNLEISTAFIKKYSGFDLNKKIRLYITHPAVGNGRMQNRNKNIISFGAWPTFDNYFTVYVWHEIMHLYMGLDDISHATNQLLTDNDLRVHLNHEALYPLQGHEALKPLMFKLLPWWRAYKKSPTSLNDFVQSGAHQSRSTLSCKKLLL